MDNPVNLLISSSPPFPANADGTGCRATQRNKHTLQNKKLGPNSAFFSPYFSRLHVVSPQEQVVVFLELQLHQKQDFHETELFAARKKEETNHDRSKAIQKSTVERTQKGMCNKRKEIASVDTSFASPFAAFCIPVLGQLFFCSCCIAQS